MTEFKRGDVVFIRGVVAADGLDEDGDVVIDTGNDTTFAKPSTVFSAGEIPPVPLTHTEIEERLGHPFTIKED